MQKKFRLACFSAMVFVCPIAAAAEICEIPANDEVGDSHAPYTGETMGDRSLVHLRWVADADPLLDAEGRPDGDLVAWHLIHNIHPDNLAFNWPKIDWKREFDLPLESGQADCDEAFGLFRRDRDAPIIPSRSNRQNAQAYVRVANGNVSDEDRGDGTEEQSTRTGGATRTGRIVDGKFETQYSIYTVMTHFPNDGVIETSFNSEGGAFLAWAPVSFGIDFEEALSLIKESGFEVAVYDSAEPLPGDDRPLQSVVGEEGLDYLGFAPENFTATFKISGVPASTQTQLIMLSPDRQPIGVKVLPVPWANSAN